MRLHLIPARYYAGVSIPFFLSNGTVIRAVEKLGGRRVTVTDRDEAQLPFDPRIDPRYSDDWDEVVTVDYPGPRKSIDTARRWKWLIRIPTAPVVVAPRGTPATASAPELEAAPVPESPSGGGAVLFGAAVFGAAVLVWQRLRRGKR